MGAPAIRAILVSCCLSAAVLAAGCGGGGGGAALPSVASNGTGNNAPAGGSTAVAFTIAIPTGTPSAKLRRPRYVSAGTRSATIAYGGHTQTVNCTTECSTVLQVALGPAAFVASLYDAPDGAGHMLATGQTQTTIVAGQQNVVQITFDGVPASLALALASTSVTAGVAAGVPVTVSAKDAAGYTIVGSTPYFAPIALASDDASGSVVISPASVTAPGATTMLAYDGKGGPTAVHVSASVPGTSVQPLSATLTIAAPNPPATPTPAPTAAPTNPPSQNLRTPEWSIGDVWGLPSTSDGQLADRPVFSGSPAACVAEQTAAQCTGGSGAVSFHVERPNTTTIPSGEYRNMMIVQKWDPAKRYAFNDELVPNGTYDVRFQTVYRYQQDAPHVQSLIWQLHDGNSNVMTGFGVDNDDGAGSRFAFNYGNHPDGTPAPWHSEVMTYGHVDTWEIQFRNAADAGGWIDLYRNGVKQLHYDGPTETTTTYDLMSFGVYYYDWKIARSTVLSQDMTFNYFSLSTIPGPIPPG
jgi:hypothetical protein